MRTCLMMLLAAGLTLSTRAAITLPAIFKDHMVLQRDQPIPVWGWAEAGQEVNVSFAGQTKICAANLLCPQLIKEILWLHWLLQNTTTHPSRAQL